MAKIFGNSKIIKFSRSDFIVQRMKDFVALKAKIETRPFKVAEPFLVDSICLTNKLITKGVRTNYAPILDSEALKIFWNFLIKWSIAIEKVMFVCIQDFVTFPCNIFNFLYLIFDIRA